MELFVIVAAIVIFEFLRVVLLVELFVIVAAIVIFDFAAARWSYDSRDAFRVNRR